MNKIILTHLGGFPLEQDTLKFMQDAYGDLFSAIANLAGNKTILSGVQVVGGNVTDGWICYNGEILKFVGGAAGADVAIVEQGANVIFEDGSTKSVYKTRFATIGTPGDFPFADLVRVDTLLAQKAAFDALLLAFNNHNHNYNNLTNLPFGKIVHMGSQNIGDISTTDFTVTVPIPDQGSTNYQVIVSFWANDNSYPLHNDFSWALYDRQNDSFKISIREYFAVAQNIRVEFQIVKPQ